MITGWFYSNWTKLTRSKYFKLNTGLRDTFSRETIPNKTSKPSSPEPRTVKPCQGGSQGNVVSRGNTESNTVQKSVHKQSLSDIKKEWGNYPVINLKHLNNFIPYQHFKMGGITTGGNGIIQRKCGT